MPIIIIYAYNSYGSRYLTGSYQHGPLRFEFPTSDTILFCHRCPENLVSRLVFHDQLVECLLVVTLSTRQSTTPFCYDMIDCDKYWNYCFVDVVCEFNIMKCFAESLSISFRGCLNSFFATVVLSFGMFVQNSLFTYVILFWSISFMDFILEIHLNFFI